MPTAVGILTFLSWKNFILSRVEHEIFFITSGPGLLLGEKYAFLGADSFLLELTQLRRETKIEFAELLPLKVYPFTLDDVFLILISIEERILMKN